QDAEERLAEEARIVPRRDPAVAGTEPGTERMGRGVEATRGEVETERDRRSLGEDLLPVDRILALQDRRIRLLATLGDPANQRYEVFREPGEEHLQVGDRCARFVFLDECVV